MAKPKVLRELTLQWADHRTSQEHRNAVERSQPSQQERLSARLRQAQAWHKQGARLARMALDSSVSDWDLSTEDRQALEDYDAKGSGKAVGIREKQLNQPHGGAGVVLQ